MNIIWSVVAVVCMVAMLSGPWVLIWWFRDEPDDDEYRRGGHRPDGHGDGMIALDLRPEERKRGSWREFLLWYP